MYVRTERTEACSKCGAVNQTERVDRDGDTFIRCRKCGHEKLIQSLSANCDSLAVYRAYNHINQYYEF
jgi:DNA-directed RNA polymerase subunit RPC12/RpoP